MNTSMSMGRDSSLESNSQFAVTGVLGVPDKFLGLTTSIGSTIGLHLVTLDDNTDGLCLATLIVSDESSFMLSVSNIQTLFLLMSAHDLIVVLL